MDEHDEQDEDEEKPPYLAGGIRVPIPGGKKAIEVRWLYSDDPDELQYECGEWCVDPSIDEELDAVEDFEECATWEQESEGLLETLWPRVQEAVRKEAELSADEPFAVYSRVKPDGGAALLTWTWRRRPDGTDPTVLALVPHELFPHMPCDHCRKLLARFDDRDLH